MKNGLKVLFILQAVAVVIWLRVGNLKELFKLYGNQAISGVCLCVLVYSFLRILNGTKKVSLLIFSTILLSVFPLLYLFKLVTVSPQFVVIYGVSVSCLIVIFWNELKVFLKG